MWHGCKWLRKKTFLKILFQIHTKFVNHSFLGSSVKKTGLFKLTGDSDVGCLVSYLNELSLNQQTPRFYAHPVHLRIFSSATYLHLWRANRLNNLA
jgi:hypothetical protein